ncbi:MAG: signal recognition particle protein Srp54 [Methanophagales archaeon]|nr:signal recognition particle protein [Methanophagales archaeon]MCW3138450.1 signal recognition particle protein Srp54 [Methanophagales archaeon]MCW3140317.1 signal recognition particle protein Srp54 [Methanophagales archaeon]MCW7070495.1 signal recognition particle protein Srp54 [Methanophagales archaeon]MCW7074185.1 signal recognition particle protein Srp54 [Methanophagales archaeon]
MLDKLSSSLKETVKKIAMSKRIDKQTVDELVRDLQRALIQADVKISLVKELSTRVRDRALKEKAVLNPREHVIKVLYEELMKILGRGIELPLTPQKIMMVGLHGSGKTSSCAKLARYFQKKGLKPAVICADIYRPAASAQLKQLCARINVPFFDTASCGQTDVLEIVKAGVEEFERYDIKIIDTAGRHALESEMIEEIRRIESEIKPEQRLLVLDAGIGQQASVQAKAFDDAIGITGIIITKMDGTAKGGGALSAVAETNSGIAFLGTGEKMDDFERFEPDRFVSRMLGMGDIKSLIEMAEDSLKPEEMETTFKGGKFTLNDLYKQLEMLRKMGPFKKLMQMLPLGGLDIDLDDTAYQVTEEKLKKFRVIMDSMTEEERNEPKIINSSRLRRIAIGSGTSKAEVNELLKYHRMMQKMMKSIISGRGKIPMMRGMPLKMMKKLR